MIHGGLDTGDMTAFLLLERALCVCEEHPDGLDPDCLFCAEDDE